MYSEYLILQFTSRTNKLLVEDAAGRVLVDGGTELIGDVIVVVVDLVVVSVTRKCFSLFH